MRNLLRVLCVCALGVMPLVGCSEATPTPECQIDADCDDQNECTDDRCIVDSAVCVFEAYSRQSEVCDDGDDNECSFGRCDEGVCTTGTGSSYWVENETPCESDGVPGACLCGACVVEPVEPECLTDADCDDGNECTENYCMGKELGCPTTSCGFNTAYPECSPCDRNGGPGVCMEGVCEEAECLTDADCDDGIACTDDSCDCGGCRNHVNCRDGDGCTDNLCDPDTGCSYPTAPDGTYCGCLRWGPDDDWICSILHCPPICTDYGYCQNGECV